jgi:hypothetical protein
MKFTQHLWFLPVIGVVVLAAQAWFDSPVAMVAIGLPLFFMLVRAACCIAFMGSIAKESGAGSTGRCNTIHPYRHGFEP